MNSLRKAAAVAAIASFALLGSACTTPTPSVTDGYTGKAVVQEHHRSGKKCKATVALENGKVGEVRLGKKRICTQIEDKDTIRFEQGKYKGKA